MFEDCPPITLEEAVLRDSLVVRSIKGSIFRALFSCEKDVRKKEIEHLKNYFGGLLRRGYVENGRIFLDQNFGGNLRRIFVGEVPPKYMDVGQYDFGVV